MPIKRLPAVAYGNGRVVLMTQHEDSISLTARHQSTTGVLRYTALLYHEGESIVLLRGVETEEGQTLVRTEAEAFFDEARATRAAMHYLMHSRDGQGAG